MGLARASKSLGIKSRTEWLLVTNARGVSQGSPEGALPHGVGVLGALCEAVGAPPAGLLQPAAPTRGGSRGQSTRPTWTPWHGARPPLSGLSARTQICSADGKATGVTQEGTVALHTAGTGGSGASPPPAPRAEGRRAALPHPRQSPGLTKVREVGSSDAAANGETLPQRATSRFTKIGKKGENIY